MLHSFKTFYESVSLEYHETLNPRIFDLDKNKMHSDVRLKLLQFAKTWVEFAKLPANQITDIYMTGGNANYNYTSQSDIDVHIVLDKRCLGIPRVYLEEYLKDKKTLWTLTHNVTVAGYPLEPYAQDKSEQFPAGQGVYSIKRDVWVIEPVHGSYDFQHDPMIEKKSNYYAHVINQLLSTNADEVHLKRVKDRLNNMRSAGLEKAGEFSRENLVFKNLRNLGYIDKLKDTEHHIKDEHLSL